MKMKDINKNNITSDILIYEDKNNNTKVEVKLIDDTVWLTQDQMASLFGKAKSTINEHIKNIYEEKELEESITLRKFGISEFMQKPTNYYNLDVIISVGYRVKSIQGTKFRQWATKRIKEYIVKGFTIDDERLKQEGGKNRYFNELLQRIRDIRNSERNFCSHSFHSFGTFFLRKKKYQKITDIYTTSIDYNKSSQKTRDFFAIVQNKIHYAVHGKTASELIYNRVDSKKKLLGLTNFRGDYITLYDVGIAKNYLSEDELKELNLIVSMYLDFAELQAMNEKPMRMEDWINKLDSFLKLSEKQLLEDLGNVSHKEAIKKPKKEFEKFKKEEDRNYVSDFDREVKKYLKIEKENVKK
jgi:hypothetical protein